MLKIRTVTVFLKKERTGSLVLLRTISNSESIAFGGALMTGSIVLAAVIMPDLG